MEGWKRTAPTERIDYPPWDGGYVNLLVGGRLFVISSPGNIIQRLNAEFLIIATIFLLFFFDYGEVLGVRFSTILSVSSL